MLFLLHLGLEGFSEVDTDPKRRFVSFKSALSNDRVLLLQGIAPENSWLGKGGGHFSLSSPATIGPFPRIQHRQGLY